MKTTLMTDKVCISGLIYCLFVISCHGLENKQEVYAHGGAINILEGKAYHHHPVMLQAPITAYKYMEKHLVEWGGLYVPLQYDCFPTLSPNERKGLEALPHEYFCEVPTRWTTCNMHQATAVSHIGMEMPMPPLVDDEYHELTAVYQSVLRSKPDDTYVVAELGARWGTWGYRSLSFLRSQRPFQKYNLYMVEPNPMSCAAIHHMKELNKFENTSGNSIRIDCTDARAEQFMSWASSAKHIDLLDIDIQGPEGDIVPVLMSLFNEKVYRLIIGTHSGPLHRQMVSLFKKEGWITLWDVFPQRNMQCIRHHIRCAKPAERFKFDKVLEKKCYHETPRGPVAHADGELIIDNPRFVDRNKVFSMHDTVLKVDDLL